MASTFGALFKAAANEKSEKQVGNTAEVSFFPFLSLSFLSFLSHALAANSSRISFGRLAVLLSFGVSVVS